MPLTELLRNKMEAERGWLSRQALFQPDWDRGCQVVARSLDVWVDEYAKPLAEGEITGPLGDACRVRVWSAWAYHWQQTARRSPTGQADGMAVASAVREGIRSGHAHPMGGDPFRDAVLVEACLAGRNPALARFDTEYQPTFDQEVRRIFNREPDSELWEDLFVKLVGPSPEEGKLTEFRGYSSLRAWLRPIARHFVLDHYRLEQIRRLAERRAALLHAPAIMPSGPLEWDETLDQCRTQVAGALAALEDRHRLLLLLRFRSGWSGTAIAELLKVHPGHFSRLLEQATERFRLQLEPPWEKLFEEYDILTVSYFLFRGLDEAPGAIPDTEAQPQTKLEGPVMATAQEKRKKKTRIEKPAVTKKIAKLRSPGKLAAKGETKTTATRKAPPSKAAPTRGAARPRAEEPPSEVRPEELDQFLPEKVVAVKIGDVPEDLIAAWEGQSPEESRPAVVCLDAREEKGLESVLLWLERFDAVIADQYEDETRIPFEPHRVVFLGKEPPSEPPVDWKTRSDLDWFQTEDMTSEVIALYCLHLRQNLYDFVNGNLEEFFPDTPPGAFEQISDLIPASKRDAWKARVKEFEDREEEA